MKLFVKFTAKSAIMEEKSFVADYIHEFPTLWLSLDICQYSAEDVELEYSVTIENLFERNEIHIKFWMVIFKLIYINIISNRTLYFSRRLLNF